MAMDDFFERCKKCKACCRTSDRFVHINVCGHEKKLISLLKSRGLDTTEIIIPYAASCRFLGDDGCTLGKEKPFQCRLYPLLVLGDGSLGIDPACTYSGEYISQLQGPSGEARRHLESMKKEASMLSEKEKRALADWGRYVCDAAALGHQI
jgi:Fe-S-cluster containining protein